MGSNAQAIEQHSSLTSSSTTNSFVEKTNYHEVLSYSAAYLLQYGCYRTTGSSKKKIWVESWYQFFDHTF